MDSLNQNIPNRNIMDDLRTKQHPKQMKKSKKKASRDKSGIPNKSSVIRDRGLSKF